MRRLSVRIAAGGLVRSTRFGAALLVVEATAAKRDVATFLLDKSA